MSILVVKQGALWGMRAGTKDQSHSVRVTYRKEE